MGLILNQLSRWFSPRTDPIGRRGERYAAMWLRRQGYRVLERNLQVGDDEADIVALDPDRRTIVIVEVKTREREVPLAEESINAAKRYRVARLAAQLQRFPKYQDHPLRFDAIAVIWPHGSKEPAIRHHPGAFEAPW